VFEHRPILVPANAGARIVSSYESLDEIIGYQPGKLSSSKPQRLQPIWNGLCLLKFAIVEIVIPTERTCQPLPEPSLKAKRRQAGPIDSGYQRSFLINGDDRFSDSQPWNFRMTEEVTHECLAPDSSALWRGHDNAPSAPDRIVIEIFFDTASTASGGTRSYYDTASFSRSAPASINFRRLGANWRIVSARYLFVGHSGLTAGVFGNSPSRTLFRRHQSAVKQGSSWTVERWPQKAVRSSCQNMRRATDSRTCDEDRHLQCEWGQRAATSLVALA
jgi:hypothetical protein